MAAQRDQADDLPEDESDLMPEADGDEPFSEERALVPAEDSPDEDLRISAAYTSAGGVAAQSVARSSTRGLTVPRWMMGNAFTRFLAESYLELRKVTWPEFTVARNMTFIVIAMSIFVAIVLGAADYGLTQMVQWVISHAAPVIPAGTPTPVPPPLPTGP